jgi:hypothetical protein
MAGRPYQYGPEDLYEYIDGEAGFFVGYGFLSLMGAHYELASDPDQFMTLDVYDMGEKLGAFGVFQAKRDDSLPSLGLGAASSGTQGYVSFYKDRYYVEIVSVTTKEEQRRQHVRLAEVVAGRIQGDSSPPRELQYLPGNGKITGSERYVVGGILGHSFLQRGLVCKYRREGKEFSAFIAFFENAEEAARSHHQHKSSLQEAGQTCSPVTIRDAEGFTSRTPYHEQIVVVRTGTFLIGAYDLSDRDMARRLLLEMLDRVSRAHQDP